MWNQFDLALIICDAISSTFNFWVSPPISLNSKKSPSLLFPIINWNGIPIRLNVNEPKPDEAFILIKKRKLSGKNFYYLSKTKNLKEVAKNLYKTIRMIKNKKFKKIAVEKIPNSGLGLTINDRLSRASKY